MRPLSLFFVAGEASGDRLGREVVEAVRARRPDARIAGVGGSELSSVGAASDLDLSPLAVLGLFEGLKAYGDVVRLADLAAARIVEAKPDAAVLIDSWGFTLRVAQRVRARAPDVRLIKLVGPQVWATRPGRAKTLAGAVDHLLCILPIEPAFYAPYGLKTTVIGHPALARRRRGDPQAVRRTLGLANDTPFLLLLPGSRPSEIERVGPALVEAGKRLKAETPALHIAAAPASGVRASFAARFNGIDLLPEGPDAYDAMAAATAALACSGTVTTELALQGTPFATGYKTGWLTWAVARAALMRTRWITLLNVAAEAEIAPEFVQTRLTADRLAAAARPWLADADARADQVARQNAALKRMGLGDAPAAERAAEAILNDLAASSSGG